MSAKAIREIFETYNVKPDVTSLLLLPPEPFRDYAFFGEGERQSFSSMIAEECQLPFAEVAKIEPGGAASLGEGLRLAAQRLGSGKFSHVVLGGVDSYVSKFDYDRLYTAGRLKGDETARGLVPGEAAAFLLISTDADSKSEYSLTILGWASASESDHARSERFSQGKAMLNALNEAIVNARSQESRVAYVISNANGERYSFWESMITRTRFYRTRREHMPTFCPAVSAGETGSASGALALLFAGYLFSRGYSSGQTAMVEIASEGEGRSACLVASL